LSSAVLSDMARLPLGELDSEKSRKPLCLSRMMTSK
jgi:hypothetical protein